MLHFVAGFGLLTSWLWMLFLQGPLLEQLAQKWSVQVVPLFLAFLLAQALIGLINSYALRFWKLLTSKAAINTLTFVLLSTLLLFSLLPSINPSVTTIFPFLPLLFAIISGLCSAPLFIIWMESFGMLSLTKAAQALAGSLCVSSLFTLLTSYLPLWAGILLVFCSLIVSQHLLLSTALPAISKSGGAIALPIRYFLSTRLIVLIALLYVAGGSIFCTLSIAPTTSSFYYLSNIVYALACLFSIYLLKNSLVPDLHSLFRPILPFIGLGFLLFPFFSNSLIWLPLSLVQIGVAFLDMYTWLLFSVLAKNHLHPSAVCSFGLGLMTLFIVGGNILSLVLASVFTSVPLLNIVCLIAGGICLFSTQLFFSNWLPPGMEFSWFRLFHAKESPSEKPVEPEENMTVIPDGTKTIHPIVPSQEETLEIYKTKAFSIYLTPREKQVLFLLVRSYSNKAIAEKLFISNNTVKYHIKNIYQKFDVTNKQELIDLLFDK